mgnify:CR=1 FL=1|tara:strand:- start:43 stop:477 length:435 start_codon:yes stop_codon:yes gene_type:complete
MKNLLPLLICISLFFVSCEKKESGAPLSPITGAPLSPIIGDWEVTSYIRYTSQDTTAHSFPDDEGFFFLRFNNNYLFEYRYLNNELDQERNDIVYTNNGFYLSDNEADSFNIIALNGNDLILQKLFNLGVTEKWTANKTVFPFE